MVHGSGKDRQSHCWLVPREGGSFALNALASQLPAVAPFRVAVAGVHRLVPFLAFGATLTQ